ncbi:glycosyltransferase family 2 protein [Scytonema sp. NUACC26]|uniref:glycosyltransferase family 2 protein n=1 Tax=Scytonema sp. NUACC26 TaxID=3140176 RepID=UPI0034DC5AF4
MNKLLTIAIPTYNRANLLDKQLTWLSKSIKGYEQECEIIISDNCSTDHTQEVIKKWQQYFQNVTFQANRNSENIGVMKNIAYCINAATSKYIWTIGDDDPIQERTLSYVVTNLQKHSDLSLFILNFSCRYESTGDLIYQRCFDVKDEEISEDGKAVFERCLQENHSGVGFMTAQIYRTKDAQVAIRNWSSGLGNMEAQVYWTAFCAACGSAKVSKETYVESAFGSSYWMREPKTLLKMQYTDLPKLYVKLIEIGYSRKFCRKLVLKHFFKNNWKVFFGALRRWPVLAMKIIIPYLALVGKSAWQFVLSP